MSSKFNERITIKQLEEEIMEKGKTVKQVAREQGYSNTSAVYQRLQRHGWTKLSKLNFQDWGGATLSLDSGIIDQSLNLKELNRDNPVFFDAQVIKKDTDRVSLAPGDIVLKVGESEWVKNE